MKLRFQCLSVGVTSAPHCAMEPIPDSRAAERGEGKERTQNRCVETGEHAGTLTEGCCIQLRALRKRPLLRGLQAKASGSWIHLMQVAKAKVRLSPSLPKKAHAWARSTSQW